MRGLEGESQRARLRPSSRSKFQAVALLAREERSRTKVAEELTESQRADRLKRLDAVATVLARTAARDSSLFTLLEDDAELTDGARVLKRELLQSAGMEPPVEAEPEPEAPTSSSSARQVVPQSVVSRQLANPFLAPDFSAARKKATPPVRRLATWELIGPLLSSFERAGDGVPACMPLPEEAGVTTPAGTELMRHQARVVGAAADGHRTFLLADEPGLGKTAQALLAAEAAAAYPLLVVVPNVVKHNWAREVHIWTPRRPVSVVHGDGDTLDGFADIIVVNYELLNRHLGWLSRFGFRGMVIDEAHYIKNKTSQRSQAVLTLSERIRTRNPDPLLMALTGTPLINDIEDFKAIWQFLGWIDGNRPRGPLMAALEETGLTPVDPGFSDAARRCVIDQGIVRRRKRDVAADIPERRIADLPVELDEQAARSIRDAERELSRRLVARYDSALATRTSGPTLDESGIDPVLVRRVAKWELEDTTSDSGENVFAMIRRVGRAKAPLAAEYAAQLARSVGKVVFFAKHIDVMDLAEQTFADRGLRSVSIRGDQTPKARERALDAFLHDPDVAVIVCSLMAAGVGLNLQIASNVILAELPWTDAEQTQAIDRVHRIGQDEPVTAWRIIAANTLDTRISELIDSKAGLAARALDGSDEEVTSSADVQLEALVALLTDALGARALND